MTRVKQVLFATVLGSSLFFAQPSLAQTTQQTDSVKTETTYTEGEVKRVDLASGKITIKHGVIKNLDMPPMTMVFIVRETSLINGVAPGDQVRFKVIGDGGKMVITELKLVP